MKGLCRAISGYDRQAKNPFMWASDEYHVLRWLQKCGGKPIT